jgi:hypothetical protein
MSLSLLLPLGLVALASLIVPLLIHLIRQSEQIVIDFPALRWLRESVRPRRRLRFDDFWLLASRLLLLILMALLLAMPVLNGNWHRVRHWVVLAPGVDIKAARALVTDKNAEWRWLVPGFPELDDSQPIPDKAFSSLLREFDARLPDDDSLTVIVPRVVGDLDAERIALRRAVDWQIAPEAARDDVSKAEPEVRSLALRHGSEPSEGLRYIRAALTVLKTSDPAGWEIDDQPSSVAVAAKTDALIWLGSPLPEALKSWVGNGGRALIVDDAAGSGQIVWRDEDGGALARDERVGNGHIRHLHGPLTPADLPALLDADFPERLRALLAAPMPPPTQAYANEAKPIVSADPSDKLRQRTDLTPLIGVLIGFVFLIERLLATRRRRSP